MPKVRRAALRRSRPIRSDYSAGETGSIFRPIRAAMVSFAIANLAGLVALGAITAIGGSLFRGEAAYGVALGYGIPGAVIGGLVAFFAVFRRMTRGW